MNNSLKKQAAMLIAGRGVGFIIAAVIPLIMVRIFSQFQYGEYRQIMLVVTMAIPLMSLGMEKSLYYFFPTYPRDKDVYLSITIAFYISIGAVCFFMLWFFRGYVLSVFNNPNFDVYIIPLGLVVIAMAFSLIIETVLIVEKKTQYASLIMILTKVAHCVFVVVGALLGGVLYALYGILIYLSIKALMSCLYFFRKYEISLFKMKAARIKEQIKYAIPLGLGGAISIIYNSVDKLAVSHFLGTESFAVYSVGCFELPFIFIFFQSIGDIVLLKVVEEREKGNSNEVLRIWHYGIEKSALIGIPMYIFCFYFADTIITTLFTDRYAESVPIFKIMIFMILLNSARHGVIPRAYARTKFVFYINLIAVIIMVPSGYIAVKNFGMIGAIYAFVGIQAFVITSSMLYSKHILTIPYGQLLPFKKIWTILACAIVSFLMVALLDVFIGEINQWLLLIILFAVYNSLLIYFSHLFGLWKLDDLIQIEAVRKFIEVVKDKYNRIIG